MNRITFDHGETPESYCATYGKANLLASLREELLHPGTMPSIKEKDIDECFERH